MKHPVTPDGHYFVVRGRLWRMAKPGLDDVTRDHLVARLMAARRAVRDAKKAADREAESTAHRAVDEAKQALGERGPVWWDDGSPDLNRRMAKNTLYADWYAKLTRSDHGGL
ncbi:hypothetical protein IVB22_11020 [Bradyrhizobium sp. 190]|uniref:hypothetical protein n=1 Tax=Bradyrhizobium sp. 190 TaxID=2782658 RepID=UPI001FF9ED4F|nr:hypothetical protein [Bradyrhizobium sp. 190]MCK1513091.1 hypothetical protein [Bradyrhizobium sp. 190]